MTSPNNHQRLQTLTSALPTPLGPIKAAPVALAVRQQQRTASRQGDKQLTSLSAAFDAFDIRDGATLSFHHHYRNGDLLLNAVLAEAERRGLRGLTIAPSSLFPVHAPLAEHIQNGLVTAVITDYAKGPAADALLNNRLANLPVLQSHGGRARALASGALTVDFAFIGASVANPNGACTGRGGTLPCGPLGYAMVDAAYARNTIVCAHEISDAVLPHIDVPASHVDGLIQFENPGDISGIASDTTLPATTPQAHKIGETVAQVIAAAGYMKEGISLQTGAGGFSLASVPHIGKAMASAGIQGSYISGGITSAHVALHEAGLFGRIHDVQCFDTHAVASSIHNPNHHAMSAAEYASPLEERNIVDQLSVMILGAVEIDSGFNVNVTIAGDGRLIGGPGGHPDAAQGAALTIVTTGLTAGGYPKLVDNVRCVTTKGANIDVLVSDQGVAVNPANPDLQNDLIRAGIPVVDFSALQNLAQDQAERPPTPLARSPRILIEDRSGGILDWA